MGLRINTNVPAITALRNLRSADRLQAGSLERLSTGLRINRASDDPAGLVISEQLRAQIASLNQAVENSESAKNMISTAEAALQEVSDLLIDIRDSIEFALNTGGATEDQIAAEQDNVDSAIDAIDRIAATTRFAGRNLLNGSSGFNVVSQSSGIGELRLRSVSFLGLEDRTFSMAITTTAQRATMDFGAAGASGATIRITGALGSEDVQLGANATAAQVGSAINAVSQFTGVFASAGVTDLYSEEFGSDEIITVEVVEGDMDIGGGTVSAGNPDDIQTASGVDVAGTINGTSFSGDGNRVTIVTKFLNAQIDLVEGATPTSETSFRLANSGLTFQLNENAQAADQMTVGIAAVSSNLLGAFTRNDELAIHSGEAGAQRFGFLNSLKTGDSNDLSTDAANAMRVVDAAIEDVNSIRQFLGATEAQSIDANINALGVAVENLTASESAIRDLDFAAETADFTRNQILFQAGVSVLASANLIPQTVLTLLA